MILKSIEECDRRFDFFSLKVWPTALPPIAYKSHLLCGFARRDGIAISIDNTALEILLIAIYKELNIFELSRLFAIEPQLDFSYLAERSGFSWCENLKLSLITIKNLDLATQHWMEQKSFSARDIQILRSFSDYQKLIPIFDYLKNSSASKSEAVQILEIAGELILLERPLPQLNTSSAALIEDLEKLRSPMANSTTQTKNNKLGEWSWPKSTSGKFMRRGDQTQIEVKIQASSAQELKTRLSALEGLSAYL